jgi:hypothetical protein
MSQFLAVAWVVHPDLIPNEVGCVVPEPQEPFVDRQPPLFLRASEIIHSKRDTLGFHALVKILEVHDFSPQAGSSDDGSSSESSGSSGGDGLPRPVGHSSLRPWPATPPPWSAGGDWSCLPRHGGDVQWDMPVCAASCCTVSKAATGSQGRRRQAKESTFFGCVPHCRAEGVLPVHRVMRKACPDAMATGVKSRQLTSTEAKFKKMLGEKAYHSRGGRTAGGTVASCATQGD